MKTEKKIWEEVIFPEFNDNLIIHFEVPIWDNEVDFEITLEIFWNKNKIDRYIPINIFFSTPCYIEYTFENGITIKGTLAIKKFSDFHSKDTLGVFADFHYYKNLNASYIWHTEGFLIGFGYKIIEEETEVIVIEEAIIRKKEISNIAEINPTVTTNSYTDLFPYIYVSGWPKISESEKNWNFFTYIPFTKSPPLSKFTDKLTTLKAANNRIGIQSEAVSFINGEGDYKNEYVSNVKKLSLYINGFLTLYNDFEKYHNLTCVVEEVCDFFKIDTDTFLTYLNSNNYFDEKERVWESYFALIIEMGYQNNDLEKIIKVLTLCNFLEIVFNNLNETKSITTINQKKLSNLFCASIILDSTIFPLPPYSILSPPSDKSNVIFPFAIGDLHLVKYKLLRYEMGEMASITSIMPGEKRKLVNRKLDRTEDKEISKNSTFNQSSNTNNEQNNDFNEELWNAIAETMETTEYPGNGLTSTYGPPTNVTIKGSFTKTNTTQTPDKKQLSSFAKKILNRTKQRVSEKINKVRAHTELKELEDTSISFLNNSNNTEPVYGIYCWLNKVYQAKVINYGNRMLFSFIVPNPADEYIKQLETLDNNDLTKPKSLEDFETSNTKHVFTYTDITTSNYLEMCQYYNIQNFPLPPQDTIVVSDVVNLSESKLISLPSGYCAKSASIEYAFGSGQSEAIINGFLGQNSFTLNRSEGLIGTKDFSILKKEQTTISVSVAYNATLEISPPNTGFDFKMGTEISCSPLPQTILSWQISLYQLLYDASIAKMEEYNLKINSSGIKKGSPNPLSERLTVKVALEKQIRKQLLENALQVKGLSSNSIYSQSNPSMQYNQPEIIQYLNSAIEWNEMSYTFFDQYDNQGDLFAVSSVSPDFFSAFLKSNYARVVIPINPLFNYGFLYFLNTGIIWTINDSFTPCFDDFNSDKRANIDQLSVVYELKKTFQTLYPKQELIDSWEVLIPTSMQILQNKKFLNIKNHE